MTVTDPEWLKVELAKPGRSQSGLARHMGLDSSAINRLVNGGRELKAREIEQVQEYLASTARDMSPLAERLTRLMAEADTNPFRLANDAGLDGDYVRNILRGKSRMPGAEQLAAIARALGTTADDLLAQGDAGPRPAPVSVRSYSMPNDPPHELTVDRDRVKLNLTAEVSITTAARILAMIEEDR